MTATTTTATATTTIIINNIIIFTIIYNYKFFKDFTNHRKKTNRVVVFSRRPFPNLLKYMDYQ